MAKIKTRKIAKPDDMSVAPSQGSGIKYGAIKQGFYTAVVASAKDGSYRSNFKEHGTWTMMTVAPDLRVEHEGDMWSFSRHDLIVGAVDEDGVLTRPDGDASKSPVWGGDGGAMFFLKELGCFVDNGDGTYALDLDTDTLAGRVLRVKLVVESYCKADRQYNMRNAEFGAWLAERGVSASGEIDVIRAVVTAFNEEHTLDMNIKSVPVAFYALTPEHAEKGGYYHDEATHQTYVDEQAYTLAEALAELEDETESF